LGVVVCIDTEEEEDCQKEFLEKNLEKNLKTTDDFFGGTSLQKFL
tara:strand:+ start:277 stop:411 length:135 start_codon:yes stop_codon:yes gene_type:complete